MRFYGPEEITQMNPHDRDKVIAAIRSATDTWTEDTTFIERFYAIAHEDGRQADKADAERYRWLCEQNEKGVWYFHLAIGARGLSGWRTKHELDDIIDRARGDNK